MFIEARNELFVKSRNKILEILFVEAENSDDILDIERLSRDKDHSIDDAEWILNNNLKSSRDRKTYSNEFLSRIRRLK